MTRRRTQIVFGIATLDLVFASFNALAQSQPMSVAVDLDRRGGDVAVTTRVVRFADLDLSRNSGINVLYQRLKAAAESVCSPLHGSRSLRTQIQWRNCRDTAIANAAREIDHPLLTQLHRLSTSQAD